MMEYKLRSELRGHKNDVRRICVCTDENIALSSRDGSIRIWSLASDKRKYSYSKLLFRHRAFVGPLAWIPPNEDYPEGRLVSGSMDNSLLVLNLINGDIIQTLKGHKMEVTGVTLVDDDIVSSSVDQTLKRWRNGQLVESWEAHQSPVQAVIKLPSGVVKLWKGKTSERTFAGHAGTVRGLAVMPDLGFLSASHDGSIRLWALSGEVLLEMVGHTSIVYSVDAHASGLIVSGSEDRYAKIWKDGVCVQSLEHPGCVRDAKFLDTGDIVTACSDGVVRVWTVRGDMIADQMEIDAYESQLSQYKLSRKKVGGMKLDELPGLDALTSPGTSDGQTKVVRKGDNGVAYGWNMNEQRWDKIGEVVDGPDGVADRPIFDGVQYDFAKDYVPGQTSHTAGFNNKNRWSHTGVWWDLNTCPVPDGYDVRRVRLCIESVARKHFGRRPVSIFAIGNLEIISPLLLKEISSAGILLSHAPTPFGTAPVLFDVLCEWQDGTPYGYIMLISGAKSWYSPSLMRFGYEAVRAFPNSRPPAQPWSSCEELHWETFLLKGPQSVVETSSQETVEPAWFCRVCGMPSRSCDAFIEHLKSREHARALSPEHHLLRMHWDSFTVNEFDEPLLFCRVCNYKSFDRHNMIIHFNSEEHSQISACSPCPAFNKRLYPLPKTTVVLWDLDTCPVPPGYDIGCVRPSIESALKKLFGNLPVTVFAIGNLEFTSPQVLKEISSSGILLIHSPFDDGATEVADVLRDWRKRNPSWGKRNPSRGYNVMLISGNASWCSHLLLRYGHTILRAFPKCKPAETYGSYKEWLWENLLEENSSPSLETNSQSQILEGEHACRLCEISFPSSDSFFNHIKTKEHEQELWDIVPQKDGKPIFFCPLCNYPGYKLVNMSLHFNSEQHANNVRIYTPKNVMMELECGREEYVRSNVGISKDNKILLPKLVELYAKDTELCHVAVLDMIGNSVAL